MTNRESDMENDINERIPTTGRVFDAIESNFSGKLWKVEIKRKFMVITVFNRKIRKVNATERK